MSREYFQVSHIGPDHVDHVQRTVVEKTEDNRMSGKEKKIIFMLSMVIG